MIVLSDDPCSTCAPKEERWHVGGAVRMPMYCCHSNVIICAHAHGVWMGLTLGYLEFGVRTCLMNVP